MSKLIRLCFMFLLLVFMVSACNFRPAEPKYSFPHQNPATRQEIIYSYNDGTSGDSTLWAMQPDGSSKHQILSLFGSLVEGKISDDGNYLAIMLCNSWIAGRCEFDVMTYPDLKATVATGHALRAGGLSWEADENVLYTLDWYSADIQTTSISSSTPSTTYVLKAAPHGIRPLVDNTGIWAYQTDSGVMAEGNLIPNMQYPTVAAASSVVAGSCGGYYCELETIEPRGGASISDLEVEEPEMAFSTDGLTSVVYVHSDNIYLHEWTSGKTFCLTCGN